MLLPPPKRPEIPANQRIPAHVRHDGLPSRRSRVRIPSAASKRVVFAGFFASGSRIVRLLQQTMNRQSWRPELPRAPEKQPIRRPSLSPGTRRLPAGCRRSRVRLDGRAPSSTTKPRKLGLDTRLLLSASGEQQRAAGSRLLRCSSNPSARPPHECTPASASQQRRYARAGAPHRCRRSSEPRSPCRDCPQQTATKHGVPRMHGAKRREKLSVSDTRFFGSCQPAGAPRGTTMASHDTHPRHHLPAWAASYDVRLSLIVAACLLVEAVVAKEVLDVELDYFSQWPRSGCSSLTWSPAGTTGPPPGPSHWRQSSSPPRSSASTPSDAPNRLAQGASVCTRREERADAGASL